MITADMNCGKSAIRLRFDDGVKTYDQDVPVERRRIQVLRRLGEEVHHEAQDQEAHADDVDWQSPDAKAPRAWKQRLPDKTLPYDAADRDDVGTGKRTSAERCDDVESDLTAQIDQR